MHNKNQIIIFSMFFEESSSQDKGLFTFYREQAERDEQIRRNRKLRKELKKMESLNKNKQEVVVTPVKELSPIKINTVRKVFSLKEYIKKEKPSICKERLVESIVDMSSHIQDQYQISSQKEVAELKLKEPTFVSKTKKYKQKLNELNLSLQHQKTTFLEDTLIDELRIESLDRKDQAGDLKTSRMKPAIHINRSSLELPDIRKSQEKVHYYKPKKSIKSKLILQALKINDRDKIRNIRDHITSGRTMVEFPITQQLPGSDYYGKLESKALQFCEFEQKGMLSVLNRLKRKI